MSNTIDCGRMSQAVTTDQVSWVRIGWRERFFWKRLAASLALTLVPAEDTRGWAWPRRKVLVVEGEHRRRLIVHGSEAELSPLASAMRLDGSRSE